MTLSTFQRIYQEYLHSRLSVCDFCANKVGGVSNAPIEFVFPNGTKMVIRGHADMPLLKTIVHLYD
jgi:hypothetical protein